ncbi:MAG: hypothetical protein PF638_12930 [Candidatus Delongbacteria bacterium]|jgi:hypothetical protein|nr:hypothetical protein [Candidatus Delongbacteria bacterium]
MKHRSLEELTAWKKHIRWIMHVLVQDYSKESTLAVFCLNSPTFSFKYPERVYDDLTQRGYTRLYIFNLFTKIGNFSEMHTESLEELIAEDGNEKIKRIIPAVNKIFFAVGEPENKKISDMVIKRSEEVRNLVLELLPDAKFYHFGELTKSGFSKSLNDLCPEDKEIRY